VSLSLTELSLCMYVGGYWAAFFFPARLKAQRGQELFACVVSPKAQVYRLVCQLVALLGGDVD
jgi:hypothetical protein